MTCVFSSLLYLLLIPASTSQLVGPIVWTPTARNLRRAKIRSSTLCKHTRFKFSQALTRVSRGQTITARQIYIFVEEDKKKARTTDYVSPDSPQENISHLLDYHDRLCNCIPSFMETFFLDHIDYSSSGPSSYTYMQAISEDLFLPFGMTATAQRAIIVDTGASESITNNLADFIHYQPTAGMNLQGIDHTVSVCGEGIAQYKLRDDNGRPFLVTTTAYYVPTAQVVLLSPQCVLRQDPSMYFKILPQAMELHLSSGKVTIPYARNNMPILLVDDILHPQTHDAEAYNVLMDSSNTNLTQAQKELLRFHVRLGHAHLQLVQSLFRDRDGGVDPLLSSKIQRVGQCDIPICEACTIAKARRRTPPSSSHVTHSSGTLNSELFIGEKVSLDQFDSKIKGRLANTYGKEEDRECFSGGTIYIDHATGYIYVHNQVGFGAHDTIKGKHIFERHLMDYGHMARSYHSDNGIVKAELFRKDCLTKSQSISFSGVGAHFQNGVAERGIQTIINSARTMLFYNAICWPDQFDLRNWGFAVNYAAFIWNHLPRTSNSRAPIEILSGEVLEPNFLRRFHTFGCPVYVLDPRLQDNKKIPKWEPRSRRGQFLGFSHDHSSTVGLIRNLTTDYVSPQYHVVYDDHFSTVVHSNMNSWLQYPDIWTDLYLHSRERVLEPSEAPPLEATWPTESIVSQPTAHPIPIDIPYSIPTDAPVPSVNTPDLPSHDISVPPINLDSPPALPAPIPALPAPTDPTFTDISLDSTISAADPTIEHEPIVSTPTVPSPERRYPQRIRRANPRYNFLASLGLQNFSFFTSSSTSLSRHVDALLEPDQHNILNGLYPLAFQVKAHELFDDNPTYDAIIHTPDPVEREKWLLAMDEELETLSSMGSWKVVDRPSGHQILGTTWAFKRKRYPDGSVRKNKARLCIRGDMQQDQEDPFDTYAPVVSWLTIRILLVISIVLNLATAQVDYTLAFVQAPLHEKIYAELPRGYSQHGKCLELLKSVYGLRQSPKNFYNHLSEGLQHLGFTKSKYDACLFYSDSVIALVYVDDCIFFSRDSKNIDRVISDLQEIFILQRESDAAGFLGITIERTASSITLKQTGLIDKILKATGMEDSRPLSTPADKLLIKDSEGDACEESWNYSSIVGMLNYLAANSRPDISFATHQAARFLHCPKRSHEIAVKHIIRYLKGTATKGLILAPIQDLKLDLYADADFAGLFAVEQKLDPISVKSRTGYVLTLGSAPILWVSKLQTEIALSTLESEYIALSQGMRDLLPARDLLAEVASSIQLEYDSKSCVSSVFEDNDGARRLADSRGPIMSPRTKHISIKYHWFRSKIIGDVVLKRIDTSKNIADIFTKALGRTEFESKRKLLMGW